MKRGQRSQAFDDHVSDEQILRLFDGELCGGEASHIRSHLEVCWTCRVRGEQLQEGVTQFVSYRDALYSPQLIPPPGEWRTFSEKLHRQAALPSESRLSALKATLVSLFRSGFTAISARLRWLGRRSVLAPVTGMAIAVLVVGAVLYYVPNHSTPVSAAVLLHRSDAAERALDQVPGIVEHRTVEMEERDASGRLLARRRIVVWTSRDRAVRRAYGESNHLDAAEWIGPGNQRIEYRDATLRETSGEPRDKWSNSEIWRLTPSAGAFEAATRNAGTFTVAESPSAYVLSYSPSRNSLHPELISATLTLRRADLHAIAQTFRVAHGEGLREYRFVETAFVRVPELDVPSTALAVDASLFRTPLPRPQLAAIVPHVPSVTPDMLVAILANLDRVHALTQEQIQVTTSANGTISISGQVANKAREQQILNELGQATSDLAVHIALITPNEIPPVPASQSQDVSIQAVEGSSVIPAGNVLRNYLASTRHLTGDALTQEVSRYSYDLLTRSLDAQLHVTALQQIVGNLPGSELASLSPQARAQWLAMVRRHAEAVHDDLASIRSAMPPAFSASDSSAASVPPVTDVRQAVVLLAHSSGAVDEALGQSFGGSAQTSVAPEVATAKFWKDLGTAEAVVSGILQQTGK